MSAVNSPRSPASALAAWIQTHGLTQKQAARELQWKEPELSMILTNRRPISERMAHDLVRTLSEVQEYREWSAENWMELQRKFNEWKKSSEGVSEAWRMKAERMGILCDADICEAVHAGVLKIDPFDEKFVQPASYDLTAGKLIWFGRLESNGQRHELKIADGQIAKIAPGETVIVFAREKIRIPTNMSARLAAPGSLVEMGVLCGFGIQMEPGWEGYPFFTLYHHGDEVIEIGPDEVCASVEFQFLQRPARNPYGPASRTGKFAGRPDRN